MNAGFKPCVIPETDDPSSLKSLLFCPESAGSFYRSKFSIRDRRQLFSPRTVKPSGAGDGDGGMIAPFSL
jgi:hypothetical protein